MDRDRCFVKYGMISDEKFNEKAINIWLVENTEISTLRIEEYKVKDPGTPNR